MLCIRSWIGSARQERCVFPPGEKRVLLFELKSTYYHMVREREREKEKLNKKHRRKRNNGAGKKDICVHVWGELAGVRVP